MAGSEQIIIIDICGTLYDSNTTFDFLDFSIHNTKYKCFRNLTKTIPWRAFNHLILNLFQTDLTRYYAVKFLKGMTINELENKMDNFYVEKLSHLKHLEVWEMVEKLKKNGEQLILVSATLDFIAKKISSEIGIQSVFPSTLKFKNLVCRGTIKNDLLGRKVQFLESRNIYSPFKSVITDNFSDLEIIKVSSKNFLITKEKNITKWKGLLIKNCIKNYELITVK